MVATATNELPLTYEGTHCVDAAERWATRLAGGSTLISICNSGLRENRDVRMKDDNRRQKREREDPKVQIQGMGELGESPFNSKSKHITVSPTGRNVVFASDMFSILSFLTAFLLHSFNWDVGCLNTP